MNILHILYDDFRNPWFGGGGAIRNREVYKRMAKNHRITILSGASPGAPAKEIVDGVKYCRLGVGTDVWRSLFTYSFNIFYYKDYKDYDLVIKDLLPVCPVYTPFLPKKKPVIASIQNMEYKFFEAYGVLGILPLLNHEISIRSYKNYLLTANSMYDLLKKKVNKRSRITIVPYGIEEELFENVVSEGKYILFLGRFDIFQKGLDTLLQAFKIVSAKYPKIELLFAGGGKDEEKLKMMIRHLSLDRNVKFAGRVHGDKKKDIIAGSIFSCRPSRFESFGLGALEVSACGRAVIVSDVPGNLEAVRQNETALVVKPNDAEQLALAMQELLENKEKRERLGEAGRKWAKNFSWDNLARKQEEFYLGVVNNEI